MEGWQLLLLIEHQTGYNEFPTIIGVCGPLRRHLIRNFKAILLRISTKCWWIDKLVLKMSIWCPELYQKHINKVKQEFQNILKYFQAECVVSGGALCQIFFEKEWESDLDLFCPILWGDPGREKKGGIDFIETRLIHIQNVIAGFDSSLVQVCYDKSGALFFTPLFMIGYLTKTAFWNCLNSEYMRMKESRVKMQNICVKYPEFWRDTECIDEMIVEFDCSHQNVFDWFRRIKKYKRRFLDFKFCLLEKEPKEKEPQKKKLKK